MRRWLLLVPTIVLVGGHIVAVDAGTGRVFVTGTAEGVLQILEP